MVFYDITASSDGRTVDKSWVERVAQVIDIPFCVAGGIKQLPMRTDFCWYDKISINSPALANPDLINQLADRFGVQHRRSVLIVGLSRKAVNIGLINIPVMKKRTRQTTWQTVDWVQEVQKRGAGEIVLNMMNQDYA